MQRARCQMCTCSDSARADLPQGGAVPAPVSRGRLERRAVAAGCCGRRAGGGWRAREGEAEGGRVRRRSRRAWRSGGRPLGTGGARAVCPRLAARGGGSRRAGGQRALVDSRQEADQVLPPWHARKLPQHVGAGRDWAPCARACEGHSPRSSAMQSRAAGARGCREGEGVLWQQINESATAGGNARWLACRTLAHGAWLGGGGEGCWHYTI